MVDGEKEAVNGLLSQGAAGVDVDVDGADQRKVKRLCSSSYRHEDSHLNICEMDR